MDIKNDIMSLSLLDVEKHIEENVKKNKISKEAIDLYNKALEKAKREGEDIAIIELKKALTYDENFVEALTLLGYCYLSLNNQADAKKYLFRATQLSEYGIRAYMLLHGMGVLNNPEEIMINNNFIKDNAGDTDSNSTKKKLKGKSEKDNETPIVSMTAIEFTKNNQKSWLVPGLLAIVIIFVILYLLFLR